MKIKVANIIEEGRLGGPQVRIAEVARKLKTFDLVECKDLKRFCDDYGTTNIETTVILPEMDSEEFQKGLDKYNVSYITLPLHRLTRERKKLFFYSLFFPYEIWRLYRLFKKERFDLVHVSGGSWQYKGVIAGKLAGCKVLWHLNDTNTPWYIYSLFRLLAKYCVDGFIVAGKRVQDYYIKKLYRYDKPVFEIQAPVDVDYFNPEVAVADKLISSKKGLKIVSVGNINPFKGFHFFIKMARILTQDYPLLNFFIVGADISSQKDYSNKLRQLLKQYDLKNVYFYGSSKDVRAVLKAADIYVCSSIAEASPLSVWEAMAMEKAIVSTDVGDVARFIRDGKNGFIVRAGDVDALTKKVSLLIANPQLREEFGKAAREVAVKYLDIQVTVKKHVEAYLNMVCEN